MKRVGRHGDSLPFLVLVFAAYPDVPVFCAFDSIDPLLKCEAILPHSQWKGPPGSFREGLDFTC